MKTSDFSYELPPELIAQTPAEQRDGARMMVLDRAEERIEHRTFKELPHYLKPADLLVMNNTKVVPARIHGRKQGSGGAVEMFFLEPVQTVDCSTARCAVQKEVPPKDRTQFGATVGEKGEKGEIWEILLKSNRRPKPGQVIEIPGRDETVVFLENLERGKARVEVKGRVLELLEHAGETPLPPYIRRESDRPEDRDRYQTLYASLPGAVAAPTAGLHFTEEVLKQVRAAGAVTTECTLHVGLGTFQSVEAEDLADHHMHSERYSLSKEAALAWNHARTQGGRVIGIGSTSVRTLETVMAAKGGMEAHEGRSELFIYPPYSFRAVDAMLTNFHLPCSSLIMMVAALAGYEFTMKAYREAVKEKYRFYSYGDCMLIV